MKRWLITIALLAALVSSACTSGPARTGTFIDKQARSDLRIVTYNVNWDCLFPDDDPQNHKWRSIYRLDEFRRVIAALDPDIMCVQEINPARDPQQLADIFNETLPLKNGKGWHATIGSDNVTLSRYPLSMLADRTKPEGHKSQSLALVDLPDGRYDRDIYIMNQHFACCGGADKEAKRQQQADALANWMRDARTQGGFIDLPQGTPIVVLGDLNIVEGPRPVETLVTGDISDEATYGRDSPPDWDGTDNTDLHPLHNGIGPDDFTWRNDSDRFDPSRLDYVIYTDSVLLVVKKFILNTTTMSQAELDATGLRKLDVVLNPPGEFDHLPLVVDFRMP